MKLQKHVRFDWAIKRLLRQKANFNILEGFLSELLNDEIHILEVIETESNQETEDDKYNRVDVLVKDKKGELIIIEIQNNYAIDYFLRILFGISKAITEHIKTGDEWTEVKKVISVNIVYFNLGEGKDYIYKGTTTFVGLHNQDELELSNAQKRLFKKEKVKDLYPEIYLIKVKNFDDVAKDTLDEWVYFLKNSEIKESFTAQGLKEADEVLKIANMEDKERREYQRFGEVLSDRASQALSIRVDLEIAEEKLEIVAKEKDAAEKGKIAAEKGKIAAEKEKIAAEKEKIAAEKRAEQLEKQNSEIKEKVVIGMIKNTSLSDKEIANILDASEEDIRKIRKKEK